MNRLPAARSAAADVKENRGAPLTTPTSRGLVNRQLPLLLLTTLPGVLATLSCRYVNARSYAAESGWGWGVGGGGGGDRMAALSKGGDIRREISIHSGN